MTAKQVGLVTLCMLLLCPFLCFASVSTETNNNGLSPLDLTSHWLGYSVLLIFFIAYLFVFFESKLQLRKSKPVLLSAGLIWLLIALYYQHLPEKHLVSTALLASFLEYCELFFFLLVAMTYINALLERNVFESLRTWLVTHNFSYRQLFWLTGLLSFFISPIADNLTTALIMCAVVLAVGKSHTQFVGLACINIVVAANAGGAFSPFGDITTLMVWQKGVVQFNDFFTLFIPCLVNYLIPALVMQFYIVNSFIDQDGLEELTSYSLETKKRGGFSMLALFLATIATAVIFKSWLGLPAVFGMLLGLAYLKFFAYYLKKVVIPTNNIHLDKSDMPTSYELEDDFDIFDRIAKEEWDTLFFFYGVILGVGALAFIGYLSLLSVFLYQDIGATTANILVGVLSALIDNIPVMMAVLKMNPDMPQTQWLLVTLTAGVGGSLLSIGSAAGIAVMGQAKGYYTFISHLKWTPVIALGYGSSIYLHLLLNG